MMKSKVFLAIGTVLLLVVCCSVAGCIVININGLDDSKQSSNGVSIVGLWKDNDDPDFYYEFREDGTMDTYFSDADGKYMKLENRPWQKYGENTYAGYQNIYAVGIGNNKIDLFSVSMDGKKLTYIIFTSDDSKSYNPTATRISN